MPLDVIAQASVLGSSSQYWDLDMPGGATSERDVCRFFKVYLLDTCLELTSDPVPNVRLHLASLLPALKQCIRYTSSSSLTLHAAVLFCQKLSSSSVHCFIYHLFS